jgi:hypothetical protein
MFNLGIVRACWAWIADVGCAMNSKQGMEKETVRMMKHRTRRLCQTWRKGIVIKEDYVTRHTNDLDYTTSIIWPTRHA